MLLSGKCCAATVVASKTFIPCATSAAYTLSLYYHTYESNSLNRTFRLCVGYACLTNPTVRQLCAWVVAECHCIPTKGKAAIFKMCEIKYSAL